MAGLCPTSATQTTQTTAGLSPWSQPYVSSMLGAAQQQVFNTDPTTGKVTGIQPYLAFGAPVNAQGQPVPYGAQQSQYQPQGSIVFDPAGSYGPPPGLNAQQQQQIAAQGFGPTPPVVPGPRRGGPMSSDAFLSQRGKEGEIPTVEEYNNYLTQFQPQQPQYQPQIQQPQQFQRGIAGLPGYPQGTMQAGMGPGEMMAAQSAVAAPGQLQQTAYGSALGMQTPGQYGTATDIGQTAGLGLLETAGQAQGLQNLGMQAVQQGRQYAQDITDPYRTQQFMSPYMQNVVDVQQQQARRQANIANQALGAQAARSGAFGGARDAIQRAQANAELQRNLQGIQAQGLQSAFQNAQQQQQAAQQQAMTGLQTGIQGYGQGIQGQTGAYGQAVGAATGLGGLGGQQLGAQQSIANLQNVLGQQEQANRQQVINQAMQNFQLQKMYPQQQLQYLSGLLSGLPVSSSGQVSQIPGPNLLTQLGGLGVAGVGAYGLGKKLDFFKKGGHVKSDPIGGIVALGMSKALKQ